MLLKDNADRLQEIRQAAKFAQYGLAATDEALRDAGFAGGKGLDGDMTVSMGVDNPEVLVVYDS